MATAKMKTYRRLLKAAVLAEIHNRRTSKEIARLFQTRQRKVIAAVKDELLLAKITKDVDGVTRLKPRAVNPLQLELFEQFNVIDMISVPIFKDGKVVRVERCDLTDLTLDEFAAVIAYRQKRAALKSDSATENYAALYKAVKPYGKGETPFPTAYRAMKKAQKRA